MKPACKDRVAVWGFLILCSGVWVYIAFNLVQEVSIWFFKEDVQAQIIERGYKEGRNFVIYNYSVGGDVYEVRRYLKTELFEKVRKGKQVEISYSTLFPEVSRVKEQRDFIWIYLFLGCLMVGFSVYRSIQVLRRKIGLKELL